jgi:hypothetical protein
MAAKADFTEEEWKEIQRGVTGAGLLVSVSDRDFTDTFGESSALAKYLSTQHQSNASPLIREIATAHGGFGVTTSADKLEAETLAALHTATETLAAKAPEEVDAYRELALGVAEAVANAKGGGTSPVEAAAIQKIEAALG